MVTALFLSFLLSLCFIRSVIFALCLNSCLSENVQNYLHCRYYFNRRSQGQGQNFRSLGYDEEGPCVLPAYDRDLGPHVAASVAKLVGRSGSVSLKLKKVINSNTTFLKISSIKYTSQK